MITRDLGAALTAAAIGAMKDGELPSLSLPGGLPTAGSWRPVPPGAGGGPGTYATSVPFQLAGPLRQDPARIAGVLAGRLPSAGLVREATPTGHGYLSLMVSREALARLAVRISQAGSGCAQSEALRGRSLTAPRDARLASAPTWDQAAERLTAELTGRLAAAAGADVTWTGGPPPATAPASSAAGPPPAGPPAAGSPVAGAVAFAGEDAIRLALSRHLQAARIPAPPSPRGAAARHLGNPAYAVRYAHAHAASAVRQAADLGFPKGDAERFQPRLLAHPRELALLNAMSWLPERVAGAARRHQPHVLTAYLEDLAGTYFDWQECCPLAQPGVFPPGPPGEPAPEGAGSPLLAARLWLADAARTTLGTGLGLLGVSAPGRR
ncbi:MAG: DALR anticodon-binding domain-containing protein [Streptosporangiales bacterium]